MGQVVTETTASDLALAHLRLQSTRRGMYRDDPNYETTTKAIDDLARALSALAEQAIEKGP